MRIEEFRKHFVDYIDECNELGVPATIQAHDSCWFGNHWWGVVDKCTISDGVAVLNVTEYHHNVEYKFTDKSIFDSVSKVVFRINGDIIEDAKLVDTSWSDREFLFEVEL
jgi:hypothetical protein